MLSSSKPKVCFFFQGVRVSLVKRAVLKKYIRFVFKMEHKKFDSVNYIFCTDKALLKLNHQFLNHDFYTDIITFDLSEADFLQAEVYISIDRAKENARILGVSFRSELHRLIFHGALHLCGYRDKTKKEKSEMRQKEELYLTKYLR